MTVTVVPDVSSVNFTTIAGHDSAGPSLSFVVTLSTNFSQANSLSLLYWAVNNEQTWITLQRGSSLESFSALVQLPIFARSGTYEIRAIRARDDNGTELSLSRDQLESLGHIVFTTLTNPNGDEVAPTLSEFEVGQPYRAGDDSFHVDLTVTASDAGSGLRPNFIVELLSPTGVSLQQWASFDSTGRAVVDFLLPRYAPSGAYVVNTVRLTDEAGNHAMSQTWLASNPRIVQVVNPEGDSVSPEISTLNLSAEYDPHTHRPRIVIEGSAFDELSGLSGAYVRFISPEGLILDAPWMPISVLGAGSFAFGDYKALSTEFTPGSYRVQYIFVQDAAGNRSILESELQDVGPIQSSVRVFFPTSIDETLIQGSSDSDFVFGTDLAAETLVGGSGDDYLYAGAGDDQVDAGEGRDLIIGGTGAGNDTYLGGAGIDQVSYTSSTTSINVDLVVGTASGSEIGQDLLSGIEHLVGGQAGDSLFGDAHDNEIDGYLGNDQIEGAGGNDTLTGGAGNDSMDGGDGFDLAEFTGSRENYSITFNIDGTVNVVDTRNNDVSGFDGTDTLRNFETLRFADGDMSVVPTSGFDLSGMVYHWKSHVLLSGVYVMPTSGEALRSDGAPAVLDLRDLEVLIDPVTGNGTLLVQVWVNAQADDANFDFSVNTAGALAASFTSSLGSSWTVLANTSNPNELTVSGFDYAAGTAAGPVQLGTLSITYGSASNSASVLFSNVAMGTVSGPNLSLFASDAESTGTNGQWSIAAVPVGNYRLDRWRDTMDTGNAITSADALAALRIAVDLNPNTDPDGSDGPLHQLRVSPYQFIAADVNGSNTVTSADALAILRMAVKLPTALPNEWFFVEESRDFWNDSSNSFMLNRTNTAWDRNIAVDLAANSTVNLVGGLMGDVNGSWSAPAGSIDLDTGNPNHFINLAKSLGMVIGGIPVTDQWGG